MNKCHNTKCPPKKYDETFIDNCGRYCDPIECRYFLSESVKQAAIIDSDTVQCDNIDLNTNCKTKSSISEKPTAPELERKIIQWANDRGLIEKTTPTAQFLKLDEELSELDEAMTRGDKKDIMLELGDCFVVMVNLAEKLGLSLHKCGEAAYEKIKDRKGKMINGTFVTESDLGCKPCSPPGGPKHIKGQEPGKIENNIEHPSHYTEYPVEVIDIIKSVIGKEGFKSYCIGNEIKYRLRAGLKGNAEQDFGKAMQYRKFRSIT